MILPLFALLGLALPQAPQVDYLLESSGKGDWIVTISGQGFDPAAGPISFVLNDWGEWHEVDSLYFHLITVEPAIGFHSSNALPPLQLNALTAAGGFRLQYSLTLTLQGSGAQASHGLLPSRGMNYEYGQTLNVFMKVLQGGAPVQAVSFVELRPAEGAEVFSGWAGRSVGAQKAAMDPSAWNGLFALGQAKKAGQFGNDESPISVWQFGAARDVTDTVGQCIAALLPAMGEALGWAGPNPLRVFIVDFGFGGMASEQGFVVSYRADTPDFQQFSPYFAQGIAHELFHSWLGVALPASDAIAWFHEGFTDYLALWFMAATHACPRTWFADRLLELETEALSESALGEMAFADPAIEWRDGDGKFEKMAYEGGALLAFRLDVELRAAGHAGLPALIRDFLREGGAPSLERIQDWIAAQGLPEFYDNFIAGTSLPEAGRSLERAGFRMENRAVPLTYLGIETEGDGLGAKVLRVDPSGPAAHAGIRPGDVVRGYSPARDGAVALEAGLVIAHGFGLTLLAPAAKSVQVWFDRAGEEIEVRLVPSAMSGGQERHAVDPGGPLDPFFRFAPPDAREP